MAKPTQQARDPDPAKARIVLGHGASGTAATMGPYVEGLRARGVLARAVDLPRSRPEAAVAIFLDAAAADPGLALGGHSFGGRIASLAAARRAIPALVLFSYPLHRPGQPDPGPRTAHWPAIACPVLLLSGDRDPFARVDLLEAALAALPDGRLVVLPGAGHGLGGHLAEALDIAAAFLLTRAG
ncbi:MAG: alpha/beta family hydrolase [Candidatus Limnocylindrales bacterium]